MTTATLALPRRKPASRIGSVVRLFFVNKTAILYTPLIVLAAIFLLNLSIWWIIIAATPKNHGVNHLGYSGSVSYLFVYTLVIAVQVILRTFPFALGFGVTRRDFYLGTAVGFVALSAFFAAVLTIMSTIEIATGGWGVGGRMFSPVYFTDSFWLARFVMYFLVLLFCLFVGSVAATIYMRWRATGITVFFVLLAAVLVAAVAEVTLNHQWDAVGHWFASNTAFEIVLWTLVPTVIAAIAGLLVLRGATPKN